jgi:protein-L-isoaspartate(D-aspartate) O-methyltransferase
MDFARARRLMVDGQIRTSDVNDMGILAAMLEVPRERFLPAGRAALAYLDLDVPLKSPPGGPERRLLKPMVLAKLLQAAEVGPADRVLDVGCATGYSCAILARLAGEVIGLEEDAELAAIASATLRELGCSNVSIVTGPLTRGVPEKAPYDVILLDGATEIRPAALFPQLKDGGRLVCVEGRAPIGKGVVYRSDGGEVGGRTVFDATAPLLPGFEKPPVFVF